MKGEPTISIIIPTKNSSRTLDECLESIKNQTYQTTETIVIDNFSNDETISIANSYTPHVFQQGPERSAQRNYGVKQCSGTYVLIIDSDMKLSENVVKECVEQFNNNPSLLALVIPEESFGEGFWAQCKKLERSYYVGVDRMEAARCFRKETFVEMEGYDEKNIGTEDYDLPQRIQEKSGKKVIGRISAYIYHDEGRLSLGRSCQKKFYYGQRLNNYVAKEANKHNFQNQASFLRRFSLFFGDYKKFLKNPILRLGMIIMKTVEMLSGGMGYFIGKWKKVDNIY